MSRNEKLIAMFDSLRIYDKHKGQHNCDDVDCQQCPLSLDLCDEGMQIDTLDLDKLIEIIDNYELPIKEYTLEELENLPKGTMIEVSQDKLKWYKRKFVCTYDGLIHCENIGSECSLIHYNYARSI